MTIYTLPEPFKTRHDRHGVDLFVVAYNDKTGRFTYCFDKSVLDGSARAEDLNPPPPIPAAARKPRVGEVWWWSAGQGAVLVLASALPEYRWTIMPPTLCGAMFMSESEAEELTRPATPEEAEPFRPLLDGLKRSLGETK